MTSTPTQQASFPETAMSGDWLRQMPRLIRWNLFAAWRRVMSKVLLGILLGLFALILGFILLGYVVTQTAPVQGEVCGPAPVSTVQSGGSQSGPPPSECHPLPADQQQQIRDQQTSAVRSTITIPGSLQLAGGYTTFMGVILLSILTGALIGGEFGFGTIRLALSRGTGRAQILTAQVLALAVLSLGIGLLMLLLGLLVGVSLGPLLGATPQALTGGGLLALLAYWLAVSLHLFAFAAIAFFLATLTRSTAAGIAGSLGYYLFESIATGVLAVLAVALHGNVGDFLSHVPDWLLSPNLGVLTTKAFAPLLPSVTTSQNNVSGIVQPAPDVTHALLVSLAYCALLVGSTYFIMRRRDVTD